MPTPIDAMLVSVHAMPAQSRLVTYLLKDDTFSDSWARISEAQQYVPPLPYIATELMQLKSMNVLFSGVPVAEPPNLMLPRSTCLPLDTKYSRENTKLRSSVGHTPRENPKIHIFTSGSQMRE